jgi:hypothetical protein
MVFWQGVGVVKPLLYNLGTEHRRNGFSGLIGAAV